MSFPTGDLPLKRNLCLVQERRQSRGTLRIFDLTEFPLPADLMPALADILLERFVYPGRLPPDISLAQSPSRAPDRDCRYFVLRNGSRVPTQPRSVPILFTCTAYESFNGLLAGLLAGIHRERFRAKMEPWGIVETLS